MARIKLTAGRVRDFACEPGKQQSFLWDSEQAGLALRATARGAKAYIFQRPLGGREIRITIGKESAYDIDDARERARELQRMIDAGKDPREEKRETMEADRVAAETRRITAQREAVTLRAAWDAYIAERRPKWSELHYRDHVTVASPGGEKKLRGKGLTEPGPLAPLLDLRLADLSAERVAEWLAVEAAKRPARARLAFNLLRIFAGWCDSKADYRGLMDPQAVSTRISKDELPKRGAKSDGLQREQLAAWFAAVRQLENPVMEAYLIGLLLTGARREELAGLKWTAIDFKWRSLHIADKLEDTGRTIPLTPYFGSLLLELKHINEMPPNVRQLRRLETRGETWTPSEWVFSSKKSSDGRLASPNNALHRVCQIAGIPPVTLHGLRRSFGTLSEWVELPTGIVAQIMGHKPSATAEKHYRVRPLDLLRQWHDRLEAWILEQGGIDFKPEQAEQGLHAVK
ncbi:integrase family protein [Paraburkholderia sp. UCT31]|uniref:tyrosine-type recombinase/integrase n=1 Tax=Paraburkholderia sp. UCT31 TaxID=2615209 RepID=UPI0016560449|nr:integrase family protein [Paraburkholderia sp. UCT31]MBC8740607.1 integrase family protein [Paraburkholderia sp. UCT31]